MKVVTQERARKEDEEHTRLEEFEDERKKGKKELEDITSRLSKEQEHCRLKERELREKVEELHNFQYQLKESISKWQAKQDEAVKSKRSIYAEKEEMQMQLTKTLQ